MILNGKNIVITGSGRGIGEAVAIACAKEGANVGITSRTLEELNNTKDDHLREKFIEIVKNFNVLNSNDNTKELALTYIENGIFPKKYIDDAHHVAIASYNEIKYLISWNFEHLVKVKTRRSVNFVNISNGFREIEIIPPQEL